MKCKRCKYLWLMSGQRESTRWQRLYMVDLGICSECGSAQTRVRTASAGDVVNAMLWGEKFERKVK